MKPKSTVRLVVCLCLSILAAPVMSALAKPPNIVIIFTDDLGYGDLGCYGHPSIRTPNLDRMAAEGMRFTDFYVAACVCTPSRAALLTGRYPIRSGMAGSDSRRVIYPESTGGLPPEEITIATALKKEGYATACIGKWHLGHQREFLPNAHGFDYYFGLPYSNDMDIDPKMRREASTNPVPRIEWWNVPLMRNGEAIEKPANQHTLTKRYTEEAVKFIRENRKQPFFIYLPHTFPHVPLFASKDFLGKGPRGLYGDVIEELDWSVGQILDKLKKEKLDRNTFVFFTSDNGPWLVKNQAGGSAGLLRDGKGSTYEGGMRVPGIAWWPGKIKPGVINREMASTMDLFVTSLKLAGAPVPKDRVIDGVDMAPLLFGNGKSKRETMFFYYGADVYAVRKGDFKAHLITHPGYSREPHVPQDPPVLYHLGHDPSERFNLAAQHADVVTDLLREVEKHKATLTDVKKQY